MAKGWHRIAAVARKRLSSSSTPAKTFEGSSSSSSISVAGKGHCVVYSMDRKCFEVPLVYLGTTIFDELLRRSQEEFGFSCDDGRITLPCDATAMEHIICLLRRN